MSQFHLNIDKGINIRWSTIFMLYWLFPLTLFFFILVCYITNINLWTLASIRPNTPTAWFHERKTTEFFWRKEIVFCDARIILRNCIFIPNLIRLSAVILIVFACFIVYTKTCYFLLLVFLIRGGVSKAEFSEAPYSKASMIMRILSTWSHDDLLMNWNVWIKLDFSFTKFCIHSSFWKFLLNLFFQNVKCDCLLVVP